MTPTITPTPKQHEAWTYLQDDHTRFLLFGGGAGGGKSWLGCEWLLTNCYFYPGSRWFIARNELKRLMDTSFVTWTKVCRHHKIPPSDWKLDGKYNVIRFKNGSTISLLDVANKPSEDPEYERLGSSEFTGGVGEEISEWNFKAFDILKSRLGRHNTFDTRSQQIVQKPINYDTNPEQYPNLVEILPRFLLTCNPSKKWPYRVFYLPYTEGTLPKSYAYIQSLYNDNPYSAKTYEQMLSEISDETARKRLKDGDWNYSDEIGTLFKYADVMDMFTNVVETSDEKYLVVDVARFGKDTTRYSFWKGLYCYRREFRHGQDTEATKRDIRDFTLDERIPYSHVIVDELNMGAGVVDGLRGVRAFNAASAPLATKQPIRRQTTFHKDIAGNSQIRQFGNLRAQCTFKLAELIAKHAIGCSVASDQDAIVEEITAHKQKDPEKLDARLFVTPKEEIKEAIGRSPDIADTFIMRMWFELIEEKSKPMPQDSLSRLLQPHMRATMNSSTLTAGE